MKLFIIIVDIGFYFNSLVNGVKLCINMINCVVKGFVRIGSCGGRDCLIDSKIG